MPYCTEADLQARFGEKEIADLLDRNADDSADEGALAAVIADVDALIDGHLRASYTVPLAAANALITGVACDLVRFRLYDNSVSEEVQERNKQAMGILDKIASGKIVLDAAVTRSTGVQITHTNRTREFTDETLSKFMGGLP